MLQKQARAFGLGVPEHVAGGAFFQDSTLVEEYDLFSQAQNLRSGNLGESGNDRAIAAMLAEYGWPGAA